jgi:hypothetical protein
MRLNGFTQIYQSTSVNNGPQLDHARCPEFMSTAFCRYFFLMEYHPIPLVPQRGDAYTWEYPPPLLPHLLDRFLVVRRVDLDRSSYASFRSFPVLACWRSSAVILGSPLGSRFSRPTAVSTWSDKPARRGTPRIGAPSSPWSSGTPPAFDIHCF